MPIILRIREDDILVGCQTPGVVFPIRNNNLKVFFECFDFEHPIPVEGVDNVSGSFKFKEPGVESIAINLLIEEVFGLNTQ